MPLILRSCDLYSMLFLLQPIAAIVQYANFLLDFTLLNSCLSDHSYFSVEPIHSCLFVVFFIILQFSLHEMRTGGVATLPMIQVKRFSGNR